MAFDSPCAPAASRLVSLRRGPCRAHPSPRAGLPPSASRWPSLHALASAAALAVAGFAGHGDAAAQAAANTAAGATQLDRVEVIGVSPLPGQGIDRDLLPYSTQVIRRGQLDDAQGQTQVDYLNRRVPGVQINDIQGSPYQGDLTYRGFRASPLLGAGQGLSVFLDGVRINEPFGDVVNFDLVPEFAIGTISLVPGANPAFGLNSLGGALSYTTLDGRSARGVRAEVQAGSFGRRRVDASYGTSSDAGWHSFVAASGFREDGWRDASEGKLGQVFAKIGHDDGSTSWSLGVLGGRSKLVGNGLLPAYTIDDTELAPDLYVSRREAVYTFPDETENKLGQVAFNFQHALDANGSIAALVYVRRSTRDTLNGDEAEEEPVDADDPNAAFNTTGTRQTGYGAGLSYARKSGAHQWQVGASVDTAKVRYRQLEREGFFTPERGVIADEGEEAELSANVEGKTTSFGLFVTDTWSLTGQTHLTATARYNRSTVSNQLTTRDDDTDVLEAKPNERFTYNSVNPAIGLAHRLGASTRTPTLYANLARNTRVPTVIELGCADPEEPCRLPSGLQADPYLKQVKSTTVEAGARWPLAEGMRVNLALYRTDNRDDILFRSTSVTGQLGYFANFPKTRNQGLDAEFALTRGPLDLGVGYSFLQATYEADGVLRQGERNVTITPGTRIAGLPRHTLKLAGDWRIGAGFSVGADLQAVASRTVSGNEDGLLEDPEDGEAPEARRLKIPGYTLVNLRAAWKATANVELFANVNNVFDKRYETFGALAETVFTPTGAYAGDEADALFVAPGAKRSFFVGARLKF
ncbi:MAG TPA: TonB-dependent receptor [Methylibium sp.]|uniref:TonB-dependent receptor n=1 Tax=Methylibium sp. TaxID=2067992 RepID=UPI002DB76958|nr:TonB-dependent receptor [Methylibium sp.]HEU4459813.1 TonB-dependent receptor [Methylibium sp.]